MAGTVYYNVGSRFSRNAYTVALATGAAEGKSVDLMINKEHKSEEYLKINPFGQVPAYKDDKVSLYESNAIIRYMCAITKSDLLPFDDIVQFAKIDMVYEKLNTTLLSSIDKLSVVTFYAKLINRQVSEEEVSVATKNLHNSCALIESHYFKDSVYVVGDRLTLADLLLVNALGQMKMIGFDYSQYEKFVKFNEEVSKLDYVKKVNQEIDAVLDQLKSRLQ